MICINQGAMEPRFPGSLGGGMGSVDQNGLSEASMASLWDSLVLLLSGQAADWSRTVMQLCWTLQSVFLGALKRQYLQNDYFAGGVGLMILGLIGAYLRKYGTLAWTYLTKQRGVTCVHIKPEEPAFQWVSEWICAHAAKDSDQLDLQAKWGHEDGQSEDDYAYSEDGSYRRQVERPRLLYMPKLQEAQQVIYQGERVTFQVQRKIGPSNQGEGDGTDLAALLQAAGGKEALVITAQKRATIEALVSEAMEDCLRQQEGTRRTCVKRWSTSEYYWTVVANKLARPLESVVLDVQADVLVKDARQFYSSQAWYNERGVPHRRGYLLWGPPGTGKTSTILALAGELNLDVAMICLSSKEMNDDMLLNAMNRCDNRSILVLEDIDAAFAGGSDRKDGDDKANNLSFSGLLNAIDGISAQEGRLLVMTTNHLDRLDPALIRPGRVDMRLHLGLASRRQISRLFTRFYPDEPQSAAECFAAKLPEGVLSPAAIQGYFLLHRDDAKSAILNFAELLVNHEEARNKAENETVQDATAGDGATPGAKDGAAPDTIETLPRDRKTHKTSGEVMPSLDSGRSECSTPEFGVVVKRVESFQKVSRGDCGGKGGPFQKLAMTAALCAAASTMMVQQLAGKR